jgi:CspA family cold shock protein
MYVLPVLAFQAVCPSCTGRSFRQHPNIDDLRHLHASADDIHFSKRKKTMQVGTVKFYNDQKGFGFIAPDNGGPDVFVHATALERAGMRNLSEGQKVSFDTEKDSRSGKMAVGTIAAA